MEKPNHVALGCFFSWGEGRRTSRHKGTEQAQGDCAGIKELSSSGVQVVRFPSLSLSISLHPAMSLALAALCTTLKHEVPDQTTALARSYTETQGELHTHTATRAPTTTTGRRG